MDISLIYSRALTGIEAPQVQVETHLSNGLPAFNIVGLPETAVREARDRVRSALINSHFYFPDRRITVNLAPADLPKEGGRFDLPIALGILAASGQVPRDLLGQHEFIGELALDGALRPVPGSVASALACREAGHDLALAADAAQRAALVPRSRVIAAPDLLTLCAHLNGARPIEPTVPAATTNQPRYPDLAEVAGQAGARRALEIAAAGNHNLLLCGPPGTGKTLLASRLPGILPPPSTEEALAGLALHDTQRQCGELAATFARPFRNPHHSASAAALVGRRGETAARRNFAGPRWRPVSRRVARVQPAGAGDPARAAGVRPHHPVPRAAQNHLPRPIPAGRGDEPLPLRLPGRHPATLSLLTRAGATLPRPGLRATSGSHRPACGRGPVASRGVTGHSQR